jgi:hypothetical protein
MAPCPFNSRCVRGGLSQGVVCPLSAVASQAPLESLAPSARTPGRRGSRTPAYGDEKVANRDI